MNSTSFRPRVMVQADDAGSSRAANGAILDLAAVGSIDSVALMVPPAQARPFVDTWNELVLPRPVSLGIHLTHTCEWDRDRWSGLVSGLTQPQGTSTAFAVELDPWVAEARAQLAQSAAWRLHPDHVDSHMWTAAASERHFEAFQNLASAADIPALVPTWLSALYPDVSPRFPLWRNLAVPADLLEPSQIDPLVAWLEALPDPSGPPWLLVIHPVVDDGYIHRVIPGWTTRYREYRFFSDPTASEVWDKAGWERITFPAAVSAIGQAKFPSVS